MISQFSVPYHVELAPQTLAAPVIDYRRPGPALRTRRPGVLRHLDPGVPPAVATEAD